MDRKCTDKALCHMDIYQDFNHFILIEDIFRKLVFTTG